MVGPLYFDKLRFVRSDDTPINGRDLTIAKMSTIHLIHRQSLYYKDLTIIGMILAPSPKSQANNRG